MITGKTEIYTDGSCHTQARMGAWVAIIMVGTEKHIISGSVTNTTNNAMELTAVIKAIEYIKANHPRTSTIKIISDSQYVIGLTARGEKLIALDFTSQKGKQLPNAALVKQFLQLTALTSIEFTKIKAHQKVNEHSNYNIEADKLSRKLVREAVRNL
jgi:ribonuclease HI